VLHEDRNPVQNGDGAEIREIFASLVANHAGSLRAGRDSREEGCEKGFAHQHDSPGTLDREGGSP
jgi:hypothetical protein